MFDVNSEDPGLDALIGEELKVFSTDCIGNVVAPDVMRPFCCREFITLVRVDVGDVWRGLIWVVLHTDECCGEEKELCMIRMSTEPVWSEDELHDSLAVGDDVEGAVGSLSGVKCASYGNELHDKGVSYYGGAVHN